MNKYIWIVFLAYTCQVFSQEAPRKCATHLLEKRDVANYEKTKKDFEHSLQRVIQNQKALKTTDDQLITIPVVVHVMHPNLPLGQKQNISDKMIQSQIDVINMDFRRLNKDTGKTADVFKTLAKDAKIQFCLAKISPDCSPTTGILRIANAKADYDAFNLAPMKELSHWPSDKYLNIWVTDLQDGYVGYSTFPYQSHIAGIEDTPENANEKYDGVTIDYRCFGVGNQLKTGYKLGRTLTHEIGHWLGLRHLWGDSSCGTDYCEDTPIQDEGTEGCSRKKACFDTTAITMMENFMDYTSDECMNMFSTDQVTRMRAVLTQSERRVKLIENNLCSKLAEPVFVPDAEGFEEGLSNPYLILNNKASISNTGAYDGSNNSLFLSIDSSTTLLSTKMLALKQAAMVNYFTFDIAVLNSSLLTSGKIIVNYWVGCNGKNITLLEVPIGKLVKAQKSDPLASDWQNLSVNLGALKKEYLNLEILYQGPKTDNVQIYLDNLWFSQDKGHRLDINFDYTSNVLQLTSRHIGLKDLDLEIFSPEGKLVYKNSYHQLSGTTIDVDKIANPSSIYLVKAIYDGKATSYKFAYLKQ